MTHQYPDKLRVLLKFDERLAHAIEAGVDMFLMPSRYEPCGLNQMYSLRYGTIPIVYATGGLHDSIVDVLRHPDEGTGFKFYEYTSKKFLKAIESALKMFKETEKWREIQRRGMVQDFSWDRSARAYLDIYQEVSEQKSKNQGIIPGAGKELP
jgi:starch synthase